jgi:hypothetical protein
MTYLLEGATILGGISAAWFIWEKLSPRWSGLRSSKHESVLNLPDQEFEMLNKILGHRNLKSYQPTSDSKRILCDSLVNYDVLKRLRNSTYKVRQPYNVRS